MKDDLNYHGYFGDFLLYILLKIRLFGHHWIILFLALFTTTPNLERTFFFFFFFLNSVSRPFQDERTFHVAENHTLVSLIKDTYVDT